MADARSDQVGQLRGVMGHGQGELGSLQDGNDFLESGMIVEHPDQPDWGRGQVQSRIGARITVMFEHAGKVVIDGKQILLVPVAEN